MTHISDMYMYRYAYEPRCVLCLYVQQVSNGLKYLSGHRFVHKDIATRNIHVAENLVAKISLLDCARDAYPHHYYTLPAGGDSAPHGEGSLPVRWMAPETLSVPAGSRRPWSLASDVWAYGCLVWEVFSPSQVGYLFLMISIERALRLIRTNQANSDDVSRV